MCNANPEYLPGNLPATDEAVASVSEAIMNENAAGKHPDESYYQDSLTRCGCYNNIVKH